MIAFWTVIVFWALTCINAPAGSYLWMQHVPTFVAMPVLWWLVRSGRIDRTSLAACLTFVVLHCIGARWIYSYVPYDAGLQTLFGVDTEQVFGWQRNHYDRLVHFFYGVCFGSVALTWHQRAKRPFWSAAWLTIEFVLATSALYEIAEWLVAITMAPDWADSYLGQQGDAWDAIKDMALAGAGAIVSIMLKPTLSVLSSPQRLGRN